MIYSNIYSGNNFVSDGVMNDEAEKETRKDFIYYSK